MSASRMAEDMRRAAIALSSIGDVAASERVLADHEVAVGVADGLLAWAATVEKMERDGAATLRSAQEMAAKLNEANTEIQRLLDSRAEVDVALADARRVLTEAVERYVHAMLAAERAPVAKAAAEPTMPGYTFVLSRTRALLKDGIRSAVVPPDLSPRIVAALGADGWRIASEACEHGTRLTFTRKEARDGQ